MQKVKSLRLSVRCCVSTVALLSPIPALAQATVSEHGEPEAADIVVTAQRRSERLIDVPASVSVKGTDFIQDRGVPSLRSIEFTTPTVAFTGVSSPITTTISIRGISVLGGGPAFEVGVASYIDDVYQGRNSSNNQNIADAERIEVLRGPQGTLFGKNTIAGAINITTIQPSNELKGQATARVGNYGTYEGSAYVSGPLVRDRLAAKISIFGRNQDGFYDNVFTGRDVQSFWEYGGRLQLRFTPTDALDVTLSADYQRAKDTYVGQEVVNATYESGGQVFPTPGFVPGAFTIDQNVDPLARRILWGTSLRANYEFSDGHKFTSITGYRQTRTRSATDIDLTNATTIDTEFGEPVLQIAGFGRGKERFFTQEMRITSPDDRRLTYVLGAFFLDQRVDSGTVITIEDAPLYNAQAQVETKSYALFANARLRVTDELSLLAGARVNREEKSFSYDQTGSDIGFLDLQGVRDKFKDTDVSPTFGLQYRFTPDIIAYGTVAWGYKSGGWNLSQRTAFDTTNPRNWAFGPEKVVSYEGGLKTALFNRRLSANLSVFHIDYDNIQVQIFDPADPFQNPVTRNAAKARSRGVELEFAAQMGKVFNLSGGVGYIDAKFTDFPNAFPVVDPVSGDVTGFLNYRGNRLPGAPRWTVNVTPTFTFDLAGGKLTIGGDVVHRSSYFEDTNGDPLNLVDGYWLTNARVGWSTASDRFSVLLFADNLFDKRFEQARYIIGAQRVAAFGPPRTYGIQLRTSF